MKKQSVPHYKSTPFAIPDQTVFACLVAYFSRATIWYHLRRACAASGRNFSKLIGDSLSATSEIARTTTNGIWNGMSSDSWCFHSTATTDGKCYGWTLIAFKCAYKRIASTDKATNGVLIFHLCESCLQLPGHQLVICLECCRLTCHLADFVTGKL